MVRIFLVGPKYEWPSFVFDYHFFLISVSTVLIAAAGYIINDYYDIKIDTINKPKRVVIGRIMHRRTAIITHILLSIAGIGLGLLQSKMVGLVNFSAVFLLWLYSNQLKRLPFIGNLSIATLTVLTLWVVIIYYPRNEFLVFTFAAFSFFITLIREIIKDMEDVRGDATFGCKTLPIVWGIRRTKTLLYILILSFLIVLFSFSTYLHHHMISYFSVFVLLPMGWLTWRLFKADTRKEFGSLSNLCKMIMLMGVLSMILM
jgi:4-hydroxybenzoate polyprenyltransferase